MIWLSFLLLLFAALYVSIERGQSTRDRILRWMVILGALLLSLMLGSGAIR